MALGTFSGIVQKGNARAARLGYPTANIPLAEGGVSGIYAARVEHGGDAFPAVAFADPARGILEAHLLDFSGDLYGQAVVMTLEKKLRESQPFENDAMLIAMIEKDVEAARRHFAAA